MSLTKKVVVVVVIGVVRMMLVVVVVLEDTVVLEDVVAVIGVVHAGLMAVMTELVEEFVVVAVTRWPPIAHCCHEVHFPPTSDQYQCPYRVGCSSLAIPKQL